MKLLSLIQKSQTLDEKAKFPFSYSIIPTNFANLSETSQNELLSKFFDVLRVIQDKIKITMSRKMMAILVEGKQIMMPVMQVHLESKEPLSDFFEQIKLEYTENSRPPQHKIIKEFRNRLEIQTLDENIEPGNTESFLVKCFTLYSVPATLPYAWINNIFSICSEVQMWIYPIPEEIAKTRMVRFKDLIYEDSKKNHESSEKYKKADSLLDLLRRKETGLYECAINCMLVDKEKKSLNESVKYFKKNLKLHGGSFALVGAKQAAILQEGWGKKLTLDRGSCAVLYSFISADMLEIPNGVLLGINMDSRGPVIFDIAKRTNYNIAVIGRSGSGKSFTVKILLNRLRVKFPDSYIFVIDPMGEYGAISQYFEMENLNITNSNEQLGLDPFVILEPQDAADILGEITKAPNTTRIQFQSNCEGVKSLKEFYDKLAKKDRKYLDHLLEGPLSRIVQGESKFHESKRLIISMSGASGTDSEAMILVLLLNKIYKMCTSLAPKFRKILIIDEAWMLFKMPGAAKYVNMIVRMGRKLNITFVFISQRIEDISKEDESGIGKIIDNMETKILLGLEEQAAETARNVLNLSDIETSKLKSFNKGHALFLTKIHRIHCKFEPTILEKEKFNTSAME